MTDSYIPTDLYIIKIYNHDGELYKILRRWDRLEFSQRVNDPWNHTIHLRVSPNDPLGEELRNLKRDYFILIDRYDPVTDTTDLVYEGLHQTSHEQTQMDGNIVFTLYGGGYTKLLDRRIVLPPPGQEYNEKSGPAETIIKEYIYECMIRPTGLANTSDLETQQTTTFVDEDRIMPNFFIEPILGRGTTTEYRARFTNLDSVVKAIADDGGLDYGIVGTDPPGRFEFQCRSLWGLDRRLDNTEGNPEAVFSLERGNMLIPLLSTNHRHEKNYIYIGGQGQGEKRQVAQISDSTAISVSPWGRSELFTDSRKSDTYAALLATGRATLEDRKATQSFTFDLKMTRSSRWIRDWGLGDYITALYRGLRFDKKIVEVTARVSTEAQQIEQIILEFEDI